MENKTKMNSIRTGFSFSSVLCHGWGFTVCRMWYWSLCRRPEFFGVRWLREIRLCVCCEERSLTSLWVALSIHYMFNALGWFIDILSVVPAGQVQHGLYWERADERGHHTNAEWTTGAAGSFREASCFWPCRGMCVTGFSFWAFVKSLNWSVCHSWSCCRKTCPMLQMRWRDSVRWWRNRQLYWRVLGPWTQRKRTK